MTKTEAEKRDSAIKEILHRAGWDGIQPALVVQGRDQTLSLWGVEGCESVWPVSTGLAGFGNQENSGCTPIGLHRIAACIGEGAPLGAVFKGREWTGEVVVDRQEPGGDYITTRILWLDGLEPGKNQGGSVDTHSRYIYLHGTPYHTQLGKPVSAGCIRMRNQEILALFDRVEVGTLVLILSAN
ncbi:MAG: L,D-transpeptidase [Magnetococcales bacterium]|nr:L,D-transpeptidase [Magnetococcales bacterium]